MDKVILEAPVILGVAFVTWKLLEWGFGGEKEYTDHPENYTPLDNPVENALVQSDHSGLGYIAEAIVEYFEEPDPTLDNILDSVHNQAQSMVDTVIQDSGPSSLPGGTTSTTPTGTSTWQPTGPQTTGGGDPRGPMRGEWEDW